MLDLDLVPPGLDAPRTAPDDPRLGRWLRREREPDAALYVALVGFPSDEGVARNGGRPGASQGPDAIREALYALTPGSEALEALLSVTADLGDVPISGNLEADQERLGDVIAALFRRGVVPIVLGGGHETTYGHFLGYAATGQAAHLLNWDAHPDVRPLKDGKAHSGSPFRQALEHPAHPAPSYRLAGYQPWRAARAHLDYVRARGEAVPLDELTAERARAIASGSQQPTLASFDLDALDAAQAPGVSAPGACGVAGGLWLEAAEACGRAPAVASFDVVELNPRVDVDGQTARVAALTVWHILRGLAARR